MSTIQKKQKDIYTSANRRLVRIYGNWLPFPSGSSETMKCREVLLDKDQEKGLFPPLWQIPRNHSISRGWWKSSKVSMKSMLRISRLEASTNFMALQPYLTVKNPEKGIEILSQTKLQRKHLCNRIIAVLC